jgi:ABC-2 type transport system permease protein
LPAMASTAPGRAPSRSLRRRRLLHNLRILRVIAAVDFRLKYAGSALGYVWTIIKPLALFTVLYIVFAKIFRLDEISQYYPLALLTGIVLYTFFTDATNLAMSSIVARESLLRKLSFPRLIIPTSVTLGSAITFCVNLVVVAAFVAWNQIPPRLNWVLVVPLLLQLYVFTLGVSLILATLFVRFRDIGQIWELTTQLLLYATPIIYPVGFLPEWARTVAFLNPITQILQDIRAIVLYQDLAPNRITATEAFHSSAGRLIPIGITFAIFALGLLLFKREEPWFAERV